MRRLAPLPEYHQHPQQLHIQGCQVRRLQHQHLHGLPLLHLRQKLTQVSFIRNVFRYKFVYLKHATCMYWPVKNDESPNVEILKIKGSIIMIIMWKTACLKS